MATREAQGGTLVVGGGFAGSNVARLLGKRGATIVSPENFMLFTPLLPEAASGTLEPRHTVVPLRVMCRHAELILGRATTIDFERQLVQVQTLEGLASVHYRDLVIALGSISRALPIPGLSEHAMGWLRDAPQRWVLVDAAPKILPEIPSRLGEYAARKLAARGVDIFVDWTVSLFFRRDIAELGTLGHPQRLGDG